MATAQQEKVFASDTKSEVNTMTETEKSLTPSNRSGELQNIALKEDAPSDHSDPEDMYPHGIRLYLLAGASIAAVFLISLDQVRPHFPTFLGVLTNIYRLSWEQQFPRLLMSLVVFPMSRGMVRRTS